MPQAEKRLRDKFLITEVVDGETQYDDGIEKCKKIIEDAGGEVLDSGYISYTGENPEVIDAIDYLCNEWDYAHLDSGAFFSVKNEIMDQYFEEQL